jgi:hypothetical protein
VSAEELLRAVALALPGVEERETWGKPTFRVGGRLFMTLASDGSTATVRATLDDQAALVAADPAVFSAAAYVGRYGWVTAALDRCDPDQVEQLVVDAWRQRAPRQLGARQASRRRPARRSDSPEGAGAPGAMCERSR